MEDAVTKIPFLRFPEFISPWTLTKLGDVTTYTKGFAFKSENYKSEGKRIIRVSDLSARDIKTDNEKIFFDSGDAEMLAKYKINKDDIIITTVGSKPDLLESAVGRGIFINIENIGYLNQNLLKLNAGQVLEKNNKFIFSYINSKKYVAFIKTINRGNANQANITVADLMEFPLFITSFQEQQKIADFLTAVDTKIQQIACKKALLEKYKKGISQQIFNQEIRFKNDSGNNYPAWEEHQLNQIAEINPSNKSLPSNFIYIDLESVEKGRLVKEEKIALEDAPSRAQRILKKGDILFQTVRPYQQNNLHFNKDGDYVASTGYALLRTSHNESFLYQLLHTSKFVNDVITRCTGTSFPAISSTVLGEITIKLPSKHEQQKIADVLSDIDNKITLVNYQFQKIQNFKKGLLQQMFIQ